MVEKESDDFLVIDPDESIATALEVVNKLKCLKLVIDVEERLIAESSQQKSKSERRNVSI